MKTKDQMARRGKVVFGIFAAALVITFIYLAFTVIVRGDELSTAARLQDLADNEIKPQRGSIYDRNMNVLAESADVWRVYLVPSEVNKLDEDKRDRAKELTVSALSAILHVDQEKLNEDINSDSSYRLVKNRVEKAERDSVLAFLKETKDNKDNPINLSGIVRLDPDVKRYYPYSSLASTIIGFTGTDGDGLTGLELKYDDVLKGVSGRLISTKDAKQELLPKADRTTFEAEEGQGLVLTIDMYIQHILEDVLSSAAETTGAKTVMGIVMDVKTGAVLGMTSLPDYDLNDPNKIKNDELLAQYELASSAPVEYPTDEEELETRKKSYYQNLQWSNRAVTKTYEPGSVFKVITASASIDEKTADDNTSFYCGGSIYYAPAERNINCWKLGGHGMESFKDLLKNSCNPFAVTLADRLGKQKFYDYLEAFGFTESSGIDFPGDINPLATSAFTSREDFTKSNLASYSFGQSFEIPPIHMITAISAVANGGKLMKPYLVEKTVDHDGNTISETIPTVRRQAISKETADFIASNMEDVVSTGTGKNAYVSGYRVAGKTGTSEKLPVVEDEKYAASFCGFAPANDPEISVLVVVDEPQGEHGGGVVAAPLAGEIFEKALSYLGVPRSYKDDETALLTDKAPYFTGKSVEEVKSELSGKEFTLKVIGDGEVVKGQSPEAGRELPSDGVIVVYTEEDYEPESVRVPNFTGISVNDAKKVATANSINIKISGSSLNSGMVYAYKQSVEPGEKVKKGEIITVYFKTAVDVDD